MQGKLRKEPVLVRIETECAHCGQRLDLEVDSAMNFHSISAESAPMVFQPDVNWHAFQEPNILDAY